MLEVLDSQQTLTKPDVVIGSFIAVIMGTTFVLVGGTPLLATFVPALVVVWFVFFGMFIKQQPLPKGSVFIPLFMIGISWQFLHFDEEFVTGFSDLFPVLYGVPAYSHQKFISINMISYFLFTIACMLVFTKGLRFLLVPVLFFVIGGALGNAIWHTWWVVWLGGYFPGFVSAQIYWIIGFVLISMIVGSRKAPILIIILFIALLIPSLTYLSSASGVAEVQKNMIDVSR